MGKEKVSEKEILQLWFDYLRESEYIRWLETGLPEYKTYLNRVNNHRPSDPPILRDTGNPRWETLFHHVGDIRESSAADNYWKRRETLREKNPLYKEIDDYSNSVEISIRQCFTNMKEKATDRKAFEDQFRHTFVDWMKCSPGLYLTVNVNADLNYLTKEFRRIVLKHRKEKESKLWPFRIDRYPSINRVRLRKLKEYLSVYREDQQRKEKNWKKTMATVYPQYKMVIDDPKKSEKIRSRYYDHLTMAKKLIKNAEKGNFPGDYR